MQIPHNDSQYGIPAQARDVINKYSNTSKLAELRSKIAQTADKCLNTNLEKKKLPKTLKNIETIISDNLFDRYRCQNKTAILFCSLPTGLLSYFFRKFLKKQQNSKIKRGVFLASYFLPHQYPRKYAYENSRQSLNISPPLFPRLEMSFDISANGFT